MDAATLLAAGSRLCFLSIYICILEMQKGGGVKDREYCG